MSAPLQVIIAFGSVAVLLGLMQVVRQLATKWDINAELQRKLVHVGTGLYAMILPWLFTDRWPVYMLVGVTLLVMLVLRLPNSRLGATLHGVERQSYGDLLLAISVGLCLFLAEDQLFLYVLPMAVLTLADAAAALTGSTYGTRIFRVEDGEKSIEGSVVFFIMTLLISIICLMLMTPFAPANIIVISLMVAAFGTLVEAVSWRGFDNFFLPIGLLIFLSVHAARPLGELVLLAVTFALSIIAFKTIAPKIGLTYHAARVYVTTVFLLLAVTAFQNAIAPILVLAAHAWSRGAAPSQSKYPDLDIVAGLAFVSFGWLALGNATGANAISFYGITALGMMTGLCAIALNTARAKVRILTLIAVGLTCVAVRALAIQLNPAPTYWNGPMWPLLIGCIAVMGITPLTIPHFFGHKRVTKIVILSLTIPLITYLISMGIST